MLIILPAKIWVIGDVGLVRMRASNDGTSQVHAKAGLPSKKEENIAASIIANFRITLSKKMSRM
jgi:hypothetical protein